MIYEHLKYEIMVKRNEKNAWQFDGKEIVDLIINDTINSDAIANEELEETEYQRQIKNVDIFKEDERGTYEITGILNEYIDEEGNCIYNDIVVERVLEIGIICIGEDGYEVKEIDKKEYLSYQRDKAEREGFTVSVEEVNDENRYQWRKEGKLLI